MEGLPIERVWLAFSKYELIAAIEVVVQDRVEHGVQGESLRSVRIVDREARVVAAPGLDQQLARLYRRLIVDLEQRIAMQRAAAERRVVNELVATDLPAIGDTVVVAVGVGRIGPQLELDAVFQKIGVGVGPKQRDHGDPIGLRFSLAVARGHLVDERLVKVWR
jgi:hypothetical protein